MWINAAYRAFVQNVRLNFSVSKVRAIETAVANFLPRMVPEDRKRWLALRDATRRLNEANLAQGVSDESVRMGIESLDRVDEEVSEVENIVVGTVVNRREVSELQGAESRAGSPSRRSGRLIVKTEKVRVSDEGSEGEGRDADGENEDDDEDENAGPREKKKEGYLRFDRSKHFFWTKSVRRVRSYRSILLSYPP
jgi:hypothetical protein